MPVFRCLGRILKKQKKKKIDISPKEINSHSTRSQGNNS